MISLSNSSSLFINNALSTNQTALMKNLEKLASGFHINSAADNAASLSISEKMRGQLSGLHMASKNAQDGISLIQVADGALHETHNILQRLREISVQAANDSNTADDRQKIQVEVDQLLMQIEDISQQTNFNTKTLLNGTIMTKENPITLQIGANYNQQMALTLDKDSTLKGLGLISQTTIIPETLLHHDIQLGINIGAGAGFGFSNQSGFPSFITFNSLTNDLEIKGNLHIGTPNIPIDEILFSTKIPNGKAVYDELLSLNSNQIETLSASTLQKLKQAFTMSYTGLAIDTPNTVLKPVVEFSSYNADGAQINELMFNFFYERKLSITYNDTNNSYESSGYTVSSPKFTTENYDADAVQKLMQEFQDLDSAANYYNTFYGIQILNATQPTIIAEHEEIQGGVNVTTQKQANDSISTLDKAISIVSTMRAQLGAYQNRLEHTIQSLNNTFENLTSAESRIRDTDFAEEMIQYTKNKMLTDTNMNMLKKSTQNHSQSILTLLN